MFLDFKKKEQRKRIRITMVEDAQKIIKDVRYPSAHISSKDWKATVLIIGWPRGEGDNTKSEETLQ